MENVTAVATILQQDQDVVNDQENNHAPANMHMRTRKLSSLLTRRLLRQKPQVF
jgi:hypothetical protein